MWTIGFGDGCYGWCVHGEVRRDDYAAMGAVLMMEMLGLWY